MATSKVKIYQTVLTPARNALVDDLEAYLNSLTPTFTDLTFQYIKLGLDINIKVPMPQGVISGHSLGNYVRIEQDNKVWYYFIMNTDWKSTNAVELKLSVDSINTFRNDLTFTDKTLVGREHGNRILRQPGGAYFIRTIDRISEQIPANKTVTWEGSSIYQNRLNYDWYLIYKTRDNLSPDNPNNPIYCYCLASKPLVISKTGGGASTTLTPSDLPEGQYNYVLNNDNPLGSFTAQCDIRYDGRGHNFVNRTFRIGGEICEIYEEASSSPSGPINNGYQERIYRLNNFKFVNIGSSVAIIMDATFLRNGAHHPYTGSNHDVSFSGYVFNRIDRFSAWSCSNGVPSILINELNFTRLSYDGNIPFQYAQTLITDTMVYNIGTQTTRSTIAFSSVDKTDSKIIKIIKLPYAPCTITYANGVYNFPSEWTYDSGYMKLNDASLSTEFLNERFGKVNVPELYIREPNICSLTDPKDIKYESKLYHSDFYDFKLVYDSFVRDIKLENYNTDMFDTSYVWKPNLTTIDVDFKPTNTINSKFAFRIETYLSDPSGNYDFASYNTTSDYEKYLLVTRNNEETIFSNDYLNYIRTGYNYDKKSKQEQASKSWLLGGLQLAAGVASFAVSAYTGGVSAAAGIALVSGAIATFTSNAYTQASNERSMQSKLTSLAAQSSNVAGSDDVDLLSFYNENRLQIIKYRTEELQEQALYNLFFYCGYKKDQMKIPNTNSRYWFNFVQCKPVFTEEGVTPYNDYIADVKSRYEAGVTIYHHHPNIGTQWDWQQQYENWENSVAETFNFSTDMLTNLAIDDNVGFTVKYIGPETLNGTNTYIEFDYYSEETGVHETANTKGKTVHYDTTVTAGQPGQYYHTPFHTKARIVDTNNPSRNSDWLIVND